MLICIRYEQTLYNLFLTFVIESEYSTTTTTTETLNKQLTFIVTCFERISLIQIVRVIVLMSNGEWSAIGQGKANIVFGYQGSDPGKVLS